jgi:hypothetical protein
VTHLRSVPPQGRVFSALQTRKIFYIDFNRIESFGLIVVCRERRHAVAPNVLNRHGDLAAMRHSPSPSLSRRH